MKKTTKKAVKKTESKAAKGEPRQGREELIGKITHYYDQIEVGIVEITKGALSVGDTIHIKGATTTDFEEEIKSMQVEHEQVDKAKKGDIVGLKVKEKVREGDLVYRV